MRAAATDGNETLATVLLVTSLKRNGEDLRFEGRVKSDYIHVVPVSCLH
jgi:hypothetical protein